MNDVTADFIRETLHYSPETGEFFWRKAPSNNVRVGDRTGSKCTAGYIQIRVRNRLHFAHRLAWLYVYGVWPEGQLDHIDRNKQNNRISNLREVSASTNCRNRRRRTDNTHGFVGVSLDSRSGRWRSRIDRNGRTVTLGWFDTKEAAANAYLQARANDP